MPDKVTVQQISDERNALKDIMFEALALYNAELVAEKLASKSGYFANMQGDGSIDLFTYPDMIFVQNFEII